MKSLRQLAAAIAVLILQLLPAFADDVITNVMSPVVSFQYYDALEHAGTNTLVISPVAGYQYFDWAGNDVLNSQSSPVVSYFYQFGNPSGPIVLHGRVTDANGIPLSGATVSAMIYLTSVGQANTDANGNYQMPSLEAGVYDLSAWDATHQTSMRGLTLNANTAEQNFQLKAMPSTPATVQVSRQSTVNYSVDAKGSRLLLFNGTAFTTIDTVHAPSPNLMTIVLTHGWVIGTPTPSIMSTPFDRWPVNMATQLTAAGITASTANIVAWDWRYAAMDSIPAPSDAIDLTPDQGVALGEALTNFLGTSYSQPLHFIGHSLGTIVNAAAANFLHGDANGNARRPAASIPWTSPMHMTLFDEAQIAEIVGKQALQLGLNTSLLEAFDNNSPQNGQSPLPNNYVWAENCESLVGATLAGAVNIWLQKSPYSLFDFEDIHSYPIDWYGGTIANPTDPKNPLGFQNSYEFDKKQGFSFITPNKFQSGSVYHQVPTDSDPFALEPVTGISQHLGPWSDYVLTGAENLWHGTVQVVGQVSVNVENTAQRTGQIVLQDFNYVTGVAEQGGQAVVNHFGTAVLHLTLTTTPPTISSPQVKNNLPHPWGTPSSDNTSSTSPMVWLPIQIPANVTAMAFDFTVNGDPMGDWLVCGIGTNNLISLEAKYIPTNQISASRLIDVSAWAGKTNELFFGFLGGTSTNAMLEIDNLRFYSLEPPGLNVRMTNNAVVLNWPSLASGYVFESTYDLATTNSWSVVTNIPEAEDSALIVTEPIALGSRFFRLRQQ